MIYIISQSTRGKKILGHCPPWASCYLPGQSYMLREGEKHPLPLAPCLLLEGEKRKADVRSPGKCLAGEKVNMNTEIFLNLTSGV